MYGVVCKIIFLFLIMIVKGGGAIQGYRYSRLVAVWFGRKARGTRRSKRSGFAELALALVIIIKNCSNGYSYINIYSFACIDFKASLAVQEKLRMHRFGSLKEVI